MTATEADLRRIYELWSPMSYREGEFPHLFDLDEPPAGFFHVTSIGPGQRWYIARIETLEDSLDQARRKSM